MLMVMGLGIKPAVLLAFGGLCLSLQADTDAVTFPVPTNHLAPTVGYVNGGIGWSFVPRTNLSVTWVGSESLVPIGRGGWPTNNEITFWTSTNTPLATYSAEQIFTPLDWDTNYVAYGQISPLRLAAGKQYYISQDARSDPILVIEVYLLAGLTWPDSQPLPFQPAAELAYMGVCNGGLTSGFLKPVPAEASCLILGPTFRFQVLPGPPPLDVTSVRGALVLTWPANSPDTVVETARSLTATSWEQVSNAPVIAGDRFFLTNSLSDPARFFRLKLR
jgi:hypothetical protein